MRVGPETELRSGEILRIWRKVKANGGKYGEFMECRYCRGSGVRIDNLRSESDKQKTQACSHCQGWGMTRTGGGRVEIG